MGLAPQGVNVGVGLGTGAGVSVGVDVAVGISVPALQPNVDAQLPILGNAPVLDGTPVGMPHHPAAPTPETR